MKKNETYAGDKSPAIIMGRAPNRPTNLPTIGPAMLPSALAKLNIREVWALLRPRSCLMGPKKTPLLWANIPPDRVPNRKVDASTHQP